MTLKVNQHVQKVDFIDDFNALFGHFIWHLVPFLGGYYNGTFWTAKCALGVLGFCIGSGAIATHGVSCVLLHFPSTRSLG